MLIKELEEVDVWVLIGGGCSSLALSYPPVATPMLELAFLEPDPALLSTLSRCNGNELLEAKGGNMWMAGVTAEMIGLVDGGFEEFVEFGLEFDVEVGDGAETDAEADAETEVDAETDGGEMDIPGPCPWSYDNPVIDADAEVGNLIEVSEFDKLSISRADVETEADFEAELNNPS